MTKFLIFSTVLLISLFQNTSVAQRGKHGAKTISSSVNVNEYTTLIANVSAGSTSIAVANSAMNSNGYFSGPLAPGDLIFIIQVQGASMSLANDSTYGNVNLYNNCGWNEFAQVSTIPNSTSITVDCGLKHPYTATGKVQIVRVPRWTSLTINSGGQLTCPAWNGATGGVVAIEVLGNTVVNSGGSIYASGKGFRGGALDSQSQFGTYDYRWNTGLSGAEKGEGIAGSQSDYDTFSGRYDRGAPANGGGGGNGHTAGGGGGGNAGNTATWNGHGIPDVSTASWANAWNLEWSGFASNNSSGGGRGGYSYSSDDRNALTEGPGNTNWGGDYRRNVGGVGGRPLDYSTGRLFFGGGGGSGEQNQNKGGAGGNGGGLIYVISFADVTGGGQIISNGINGQSTPTRGTDAAGGAGAGGAIVVDATGTISGITIVASGGNGGNQIIRNVFEPVEAEGTGGGGGGGYIAITNGSPGRTANGGNNGTTDSGGLLEFPPNGATKGGTGLPAQTFPSYYIAAIGDTICPNAQATLTASIVGTPPGGITYYWYTAATGGSAVGTGITFTTPSIATSTTYYVAICPGFYRVPVQVVVTPAPTPSFSFTNACLGDATVFTNTTTGGVNFAWNFGDGFTSGQQNPSHTYATAGSFVVVFTVSNSAGCLANVTQTVTVGNTPQVSFTSSGATTACGSLTVNFINNTTGGGANTYSWNFGDGSGASSQQNPSHTYSTPGTYTVTLAATLGSCSDADSIVNYITVNPAPTAGFTASNVCLGDVMNFTNTSSGATSYSWNFGDAGTATGANPSHTYLTANTFTVTMIASNGTCTDTVVQNVTVNNSPQVGFTTSGATTGCGPLTVSFVNNTTGGGANTYSWNFGDGTGTSSQQNPSHTYTVPGTYTVTLAATLGSCNDVDSIVNYITVNPSPLAGFSATAVCLGDPMNFNNISSGATSYSWDFGDGTGTSSAFNPSYIYATANTFTITMIASNGLCTDTVTGNISVLPAPQVNFTSSGSTVGCGSLTVNFVNNTTGGGGNSYTWNFGDGTGTSSSTNPSHTYSTPGTYTVTLAATLGTCSDADSIVNYITVNPVPTASFSASNVCLGDVMSFTNASSGATAYSWDFGDGSGTSTSANPYYTYATANTFTVTLIATDGTCSDTITQNVVVNNAPQVSFTSSGATTGCGSLTVNFVNNTTGGGGNSYTWNFGDGTGTSSSTNPSYTYSTPGTYTVSLAATLGSCSDADSIVNYITVNPAPTADFSASNVCLGDVMNFTNSSIGATGYSWDFGDGSGTSTSASPSYTYATANTFTVTLIATDGTCTDTITQNVVVNNAPQVSFTSSGPTTACGSLTVNFVNNTTGGGGNSYTWNFGDGIGTSTLQNPTYTYTTPGTYTVTLSAAVGSCSDVDSLVNYITVTPGPVASFTAGSVCLGETVYFVNTSTGATSYLWDFGDGTGTSSLLNPTHVYNVGNTFTITLISTDGNCSDTITQTVTVNPAPVVLFSASANSACDSLTVTFTNNTTGAASYNWDFGDGFFSTDVNPTHTYNVPGIYSVTLNGILGICISSQTSVNMISIYETPQATVSASSLFLCPNDCVNFTSTSTGSPVSWAWNFPGASTSISSAENPQNICYPAAGSFNVLLNVSNGNCSSSQTLSGYIVVNPCTSLVAGFYSNDTVLCKGSCINFTSTSQNATSYQWLFPGATPSSSTQPNPGNICYPTSGNYDVTLIVSDGNTYDTLTITNFIQVASPPVPPTFSQNGDTLTSSPATTYQWFYGNFQISGATDQTYIATASGNYYVVTTDVNGCQATSQPAWVSLIGIDEEDSGFLISLFPNPTSSQLTMLLATDIRSMIHIGLTDLLGKHILSDEFMLSQSPFRKELDLSILAPGVYFISIEMLGKTTVKKVIKQ